MVIGFHAEGRAAGAGGDMNGGDAAAVGVDVLIVFPWDVDRERRACRRAVGIRA